MSETALLDVDQRGVATLTLNRPDVRNAFDNDLIADKSEKIVLSTSRFNVESVMQSVRNFATLSDITLMKSPA